MRRKASIESAIRGTLRAELQAVKSAGAPVRELAAAAQLITRADGKILVTGLGKSSYVAMKMAATLVSFGVRAQFLNAVEAMHGDLGAAEEGSVLIAFSYSGETEEIVRLARYVQSKMRAKVIAVTGKPSSALGMLADHAITLRIRQEGSPGNAAPMASITGSLVVADLLTSALLAESAFDPARFAQYHPGGALGLSLRSVADVMVSGKDVPLVSENASLTAALTALTKKHSGGRGIIGITNRAGKLIGVITDGDIRRYALYAHKKTTAELGAIMSVKPKTIAADASLADALAKMEAHKITALFVTDAKQRPRGLIHVHQILETYRA